MAAHPTPHLFRPPAMRPGVRRAALGCTALLLAACSAMPPSLRSSSGPLSGGPPMNTPAPAQPQAQNPAAAPVLPRYASVTTGPTARLIMRAKMEGTAAGFGVNVLANNDDCSQRQYIGAARTGTTSLPTVNVAADRLLTLEFVGTNNDRKNCMVRWTFTPLPGRSYLLQSTFDGQRCTSAVLDATNPDTIRAEPSALRRNPALDKLCVPLTQSRGIPSPQNNPQGDATLTPGATNDDLKGLIGR